MYYFFFGKVRQFNKHLHTLNYHSFTYFLINPPNTTISLVNIFYINWAVSPDECGAVLT
jgi:hypothetical protein